VPKHTDVVTMSTFAGLFSQLTSVGCFNYMMLAQQLNSDSPFHTSFQNFYAGMLKTPFLGTKLNQIIPSSMIFFTVIFVIVSLLGYESKVVKTLKRKELGDMKPTDEIVTKLEKVYNGELCILREIY